MARRPLVFWARPIYQKTKCLCGWLVGSWLDRKCEGLTSECDDEDEAGCGATESEELGIVWWRRALGTIFG